MYTNIMHIIIKKKLKINDWNINTFFKYYIKHIQHDSN